MHNCDFLFIIVNPAVINFNNNHKTFTKLNQLCKSNKKYTILAIIGKLHTSSRITSKTTDIVPGKTIHLELNFEENFCLIIILTSTTGLAACKWKLMYVCTQYIYMCVHNTYVR